MQLRTREVLVYDQWTGPRYPRGNFDKVKQKAYSGLVTPGSVKRLKRCVSLIVQKSPKRWIFNPVAKKRHQFQIGFVTLTIPDQAKNTDADIYKGAFAPWLRWLRRKGVTDYVWRAELQKRGELHYHVIVNQFLHYQEIQDNWNKYLKRLGCLDKYAREHHHFRPNSVDVHSVYKINDVEGYMTKYMTKTAQNAIGGKIWDASLNLKRAKYFSTMMTPRNLEFLRRTCEREVIKDRCAIFRLPSPAAARRVLDPTQRAAYAAHLAMI